MFRKVTSLILVLVFAISLSGCATIMHPKTTEVSINSNPEGASVYFDNMKVGKTPLITSASNLIPLTITLRKDGYEEETKRIGVHSTKSYFFINCLLPPVYGCVWNILDSATSNTNTLNETKFNFTLEPLPAKK